MKGDDLDLNRLEREIIRSKFMTCFGVARSITEGDIVKRLTTMPRKGQPKLTAPVQMMLDHGLITIYDADNWPRALFTDKGFRALKRMATDSGALHPGRHSLLIEEFGTIPEQREDKACPHQ